MSRDKVEVGDSTTNLSETIKKERIRFLKTVLSIYRSRAISLQCACQFLMSRVLVPEDVENFDFLSEHIRGLLNDVSLLMAFQNSINLIHNSLTRLGVSDLVDQVQRNELQRTVSELSFFSQAAEKLSNGGLNEKENIQIKQNYSMALAVYQKNLDMLKEKQKELSQTAEDTRRLQKAELQVHKINFIREMKLILIGKFAGNSEQYSSLQQFRTSFRRNLTVDDFNETWDVGLQ